MTRCEHLRPGTGEFDWCEVLGKWVTRTGIHAPVGQVLKDYPVGDTSDEAMQARYDASTPFAEYHCPDDLGAEAYAMIARALDEGRAARARRKLEQEQEGS